MLDGLKAEGEALVLVVWTLAEEIRLLRNLKEMMLSGGNLASAMKSRRIWGKREQLIPQALQRLHLPILERALQMIADVDKQSKGIPVKDMPIDPWDGLRRIGGLFSVR
jgi:DNA polymerase-3 subunit delta